jgi:signal transduction histidine kinase
VIIRGAADKSDMLVEDVDAYEGTPMNSHPDQSSITCTSNIHLLLAYVADLELEVDRLRKQSQFVQHEVRESLRRIRLLCADEAMPSNGQPPLAEVDLIAKHLAEVFRDVQERPGYHPAHDQVISIAVRPLVEQIFRLQQRLVSALAVVIQLELESEHMEWFPARLRHILDNLISNALKYRDPNKAESWVRLGLRVAPRAYEWRVTDNGVGLPTENRAEVFELFHRAAPSRQAGLGVGLAVAKLLVEQSGGSLTVDSGPGQGSTFVAVLPRYDLDDFLV